VTVKNGGHVPAVCFVAPSGTGKTTLLEKVIAELSRRGYRVGAMKHGSHGFAIDHPGKDSHRLTAAGASTTVISSPEKLAVVKKHAAEPTARELVDAYFAEADIVLAEGWKRSDLPKIEVHRRGPGKELFCRGREHDPRLLAVACDGPLRLDVPVLDIDDPAAVADFLETRFLRRPSPSRDEAGNKNR
jgi:molybdopterin-guanine dinucleotide biosynthesis protein B/molybdopterin-guanine dinucleotide biosynthesis protein